MGDEQIYNQRLRSVKRFIPFLESTIEQLKMPNMKSREQHLKKMESLYNMIMDKKKKLRIETLAKIEDVSIKLYHKVKGSNFPLPPLPRLKSDDETKKRKPIDVYSLAGESLKTKNDSHPSPQSTCTFPANSKTPKTFLLQPPISAEDLKESLENDVISPTVNDKMSLSELDSIRNELVKKLSETEISDSINTTARNVPVLTKYEVKSKIVHNPKKSNSEPSASTNSDPTPKVLRESGDIFQNAFSEIDKSYKLEAKKKDERRKSVDSNLSKDAKKKEDASRSTSKDKKGEQKEKKGEDKKTREESKEKKKEDRKSREESKEKKQEDRKKRDESKEKKDDRKLQEESKKNKQDRKKRDEPKERKDDKKAQGESREKKLENKKVPVEPKDKKIESETDQRIKEKKTEKHTTKSEEKKKDLSKDSKTSSNESSKDSSKKKDKNKEKNKEKEKSNDDKSSSKSSNKSDLKINESEVLVVSRDPRKQHKENTERLAYKYNPKPKKPSTSKPVEVENNTAMPLSPGPELIPLSPVSTIDLFSPESPDEVDKAPLPPVSNKPNNALNVIPNFAVSAPTNTVHPKVPQCRMDVSPNFIPPNPRCDPRTNQRFNIPNYENFNAHPHFNNYPAQTLTQQQNNHQQFNQNYQMFPGGGNNIMPVVPMQQPAYNANYMKPRNNFYNNRTHYNQTLNQQAHPQFNYPNNNTSFNNRMTYKDYKEQKEREYREKLLQEREYKDKLLHERAAKEVLAEERAARERNERENRGRNSYDPRFNIHEERETESFLNKGGDEEITSPLESLYTSSKAKTGKGYGEQFRIPKKNKPWQRESRWNDDNKKDDDVVELVQDFPQVDLTTEDWECWDDDDVVEQKKDDEKMDEKDEEVEVSKEVSKDLNNEVEEENVDKQKTEEVSMKSVEEPSSPPSPPPLSLPSENEKNKEDTNQSTNVKKDEEESILGKFFQNLMKSSNKNEKKGALLSLISTFSDSFSDVQLKKITEIIRSNEDEEKEAVDPQTTSQQPPNSNDVNTSRIEKETETDNSKATLDDDSEKEFEGPPSPKIVRHKTELDRLHEDIREMFIRDGIVTASGKRMCRILKATTTSPTNTKPEEVTQKEEKREVEVKKTAPRKAAAKRSKSKVEIKELSVVIPKMAIEGLESENQKKYSLRNPNKRMNYDENVGCGEVEQDVTQSPSKKKRGKEKIETKDDAKNESEDEKMEENLDLSLSDEEDLGIDLTNLHDKEYFIRVEGNLECKLCNWSNPTAVHYRRHHPTFEVLSSRLPKGIAKICIDNSIMNSQYQNDENKPKPAAQRKYQCPFCVYKNLGNTCFYYNHLISHTGEYLYKCTRCSFKIFDWKLMRIHMKKEHNADKVKPVNFMPRISNNGVEIYGYICEECNYVQMNEKNLKNHVELYHKNPEINVYKIVLNKNKLKFMNPKMEVEESVEEEEEEHDSPPILTPEEPIRCQEPSVFTCNTDVVEENEKIEAERLQMMQELNKNLRPRSSLGMAEKLSNILKQKESEDWTNDENQDEDENEKTELQVYEKAPQKNCEKPTTVAPKQKNADSVPKCNKIGNVIEKLQEILNNSNIAEDIQTTEFEENECVDIKPEIRKSTSPPPLVFINTKENSPIKSENNESGKCDVINIGPIKMIRVKDVSFFSCNIPLCVFSTSDQNVFATHCQAKHEGSMMKQFTECQICCTKFEEIEPASSGLLSAFLHFKKMHLKDVEFTPPVLSIPSPKPGENLETVFDFMVKNDSANEEDDNPFPFKIVDVVSLADTSENEQNSTEISHEDDEKCTSGTSSANTSSSSTASPHMLVSEWTKNSQKVQIIKQYGKKNANATRKFLQEFNDLFKCPEFACLFTSKKRKMFDIHVTMHLNHKEKKLTCIYCDKQEVLANFGHHYELEHKNCNFSCPYCFYRCLSKDYMDIHLFLAHKNQSPRMNLITVNHPTSLSHISELEKQNQKHTGNCYECCNSMFYFCDEVTNHFKDCTKFTCGYKNCRIGIVSSDELIKHWGESHNVYPYKCFHCNFGSFNLHMVMLHSVVDHPGLPTDIIDRTSVKNAELQVLNVVGDKTFQLPRAECNYQKFLDELKSIEVTPKPIEVAPKAQTPVAPSPAMVLCLPVAGTASVATATPQVVPILMAQIPKLRPILPKIMPMATDEQTTGDEELYEPIVLIDEDFDGNKSREVKSEMSTVLETESNAQSSNEESTEAEIGAGAGSGSGTGLIGSELYRCALCLTGFPQVTPFKKHIVSCKYLNTNKPFKCFHCGRFFKLHGYLLDHLSYHGRERFSCSLCNKKFSHNSQAKNHLKSQHNILNVVLQPICSTKVDVHSDSFVVKPHQVVPIQIGDLNNSDSVASAVATPNAPADLKTIFYSHEADQIPQKSILSYDITCGHCKKFKNKVRSNILRHLSLHQNDKDFTVPDTAPVNPVPCLEKNEKMFDKMYNLASSSHAGGRMGGSKSDPKKAINEDNYPKFVPLNRRFQCCALDCNYLCLEEGNLRHHLTALHNEELIFVCVHCKANLSNAPDVDTILKHLKLHALHLYKCEHCDYVHNLRHKIERHLHEEHRNEPANVVVIRAMDSEPMDESQTATSPQNSGVMFPTLTSAISVPSQKRWRCLMCKYRMHTEQEALNHVKNKHSIDSRFKCALCAFKSNLMEEVHTHFKNDHSENNDNFDFISSYTELAEVSQPEVNAESTEFDTTPLWLRDKPRVKHIRGILLDETCSSSNSLGASNAAPSPTVKRKSLKAVEGIETSPQPVQPQVKKRKKSLVDGETASPSSKSPKCIKFEEQVQVQVKVKVEPPDDIIPIADVDVNVQSSPEKILRKKEVVLEEIDLLCIYGDTGMPMNNQFKCPKCEKYRTTRIRDFVQHVAEEIKYFRFKCKICTGKYVTIERAVEHCRLIHESSMEPIENLACDLDIKRWLGILVKKQCGIIENLGFPKENLPDDIESFLTQSVERGTKRSAQDDKRPELDMVAEKKTKLEDLPLLLAKDRYVCSKCDSSFDSVPEIEFHGKERHGSVIPYEVKVTKLKTNCEFVAREYRCGHCGLIDTKQNLQEHSAKEHSDKNLDIWRFKCAQCNSPFELLKDLDIHLKKYGKEDKFYYNVNMVRNRRGINGNTLKVYKCPACNYSSRAFNTTNIRSHVKIHAKPFYCNLCTAVFSKRSDFHHHHAKQHPHSAESMTERQDMLEKINELMKEVVRNLVTVDDELDGLENEELPSTSEPASTQKVARKSTCSLAKKIEQSNTGNYSFYGIKNEKEDLGKILVMTNVKNTETLMTCEQFSEIYDINPRLVLEDCMKVNNGGFGESPS